MPEASPIEKITAQIPQFVIPEDKIVTLGVKSEPAKPAIPAAPATPAESPKAAEPSEQAPETVTEKPEEETTETPEPETTGKDPEKPSTRRFERRIDRATRRAAEAEAKADALARELAEFRSKQAPVAKTAEGEPRMEDFTDIKEYAEAHAAYKVKIARQEDEIKARNESVKRSQERMVADYDAKVQKAMDKYEDFDEVVGDLKAGVTPWGDAIMLAENSADIAYYLGKHEKEAERIMNLDPRAQFVEVGRLSAKLALTPEAPKKPSRAPTPINPVTTPAAAPATEIRENQPFEEYRKIGRKMFGPRF